MDAGKTAEFTEWTTWFFDMIPEDADPQMSRTELDEMRRSFEAGEAASKTAERILAARTPEC